MFIKIAANKNIRNGAERETYLSLFFMEEKEK
jgi:hypothetical protein